eukprot:TRINITY_DN6687_c0_g1_i1.p1 TRINITY_DN6687_c0_g1~~TRINITY_DN6687_c0_g1_i1.p1  ORF type:complete len:301 (-),score=74.96 TRINITY_DN6687_c0_g1_i1:227-1129(-)
MALVDLEDIVTLSLLTNDNGNQFDDYDTIMDVALGMEKHQKHNGVQLDGIKRFSELIKNNEYISESNMKDSVTWENGRAIRVLIQATQTHYTDIRLVSYFCLIIGTLQRFLHLNYSNNYEYFNNNNNNDNDNNTSLPKPEDMFYYKQSFGTILSLVGNFCNSLIPISEKIDNNLELPSPLLVSYFLYSLSAFSLDPNYISRDSMAKKNIIKISVNCLKYYPDDEWLLMNCSHLIGNLTASETIKNFPIEDNNIIQQINSRKDIYLGYNTLDLLQDIKSKHSDSSNNEFQTSLNYAISSLS